MKCYESIKQTGERRRVPENTGSMEPGWKKVGAVASGRPGGADVDKSPVHPGDLCLAYFYDDRTIARYAGDDCQPNDWYVGPVDNC